jgi:hypothetical protein
MSANNTKSDQPGTAQSTPGIVDDAASRRLAKRVRTIRERRKNRGYTIAAPSRAQ